MKSILTAAAICLGLAVSAQNYSDLTELLRSDLRTQHQALVMASLELTEAQSSAFMPIYDAYAVELKKFWDKRILLIQDYAKAYPTMNDETASGLMKRMVAMDKEGVVLRDKYAKKVMKVLPTTVAARWMQVERRISQMVELQLANELPLMPTKR